MKELRLSLFMVLLHLAIIMGQNSPPFDGFLEWYQDCSHVFENKVVHFEYIYYPSYWLYPFQYTYYGPWAVHLLGAKRLALYWAKLDDAKANGSHAKWIAHPHPSKRGLALESIAPGWENYYAARWNGWKNARDWIAGARHTSYIGDLDNATSSWNIYCTDECRFHRYLSPVHLEMIDRCILNQGGYWHYHDKLKYSVFGTGQIDENWLSYRIYVTKNK